jgi:hypothetical protein
MERSGWSGPSVQKQSPGLYGDMEKGLPIPGGGCSIMTRDGTRIHRFDRNCDGKPTGAEGAGGGAAPAPGGADPHGQKIRGLIGR